LTSIVSPKNSATTDGSGGVRLLRPPPLDVPGGLPAVALVDVGVPEAPWPLRRRGDHARPCWVDGGDVGTNEDLVLDDDRDLVATQFDVVGKARADEVRLESVANQETGRNAGVGIDPGDP
jgi:hypothetical protein